MIVIAIKICFLNIVDNYNLGRKSHTSRFFSPFYKEIFRVIYGILAIVIEDLKLHMHNKKILLKKSAIQFELYAHKSKKDKYFVLFSLL